MHGSGTFVFATEGQSPYISYKGEFQDGKFHGHGVLLLKPSGFGRYEGHFEDGQQHGSGRMVYGDGQGYSAEYQHGDLIAADGTYRYFPGEEAKDKNKNDSSSEEVRVNSHFVNFYYIK